MGPDILSNHGEIHSSLVVWLALSFHCTRNNMPMHTNPNCPSTYLASHYICEPLKQGDPKWIIMSLISDCPVYTYLTTYYTCEPLIYLLRITLKSFASVFQFLCLGSSSKVLLLWSLWTPSKLAFWSRLTPTCIVPR